MSEWPGSQILFPFAGLMRPGVIAMAKKIVATDSPSKRIRDVGPAAPRIDPALVTDALGAEDTRA